MEKWRAPIGEDIVLHRFTGNCDAPATIANLTDRTLALAEKSLTLKEGISFGDRGVFPEDLRTRLFRNDLAREVVKQEIHAGVELLGENEVWLHYGGEPVLWPGIGKVVKVSTVPGPTPAVDLFVPEGWKCDRLGPTRFRLLAQKVVDGRNSISVAVNGGKVDFVILGPDEATGYEAGANVPSCPGCHARVEACMCGT
jgi:hypothetical protein